jgi:hypothetical protein
MVMSSGTTAATSCALWLAIHRNSLWLRSWCKATMTAMPTAITCRGDI